jgi:hypothetical protein
VREHDIAAEHRRIGVDTFDRDRAMDGAAFCETDEQRHIHARQRVG